MGVIEVLKRPKVRQYGAWILVVILALVLAYFLAVNVFPVPKVGIIEIEGLIFPFTLDSVLPLLEYAHEQRDIRAVVLVISSPGGEASSSQEIYYQVLALRDDKPVVSSINLLGASGAYHVAVASNYIYAKSASIVGSVGVRATLPRPEQIDEDAITTGPFKAPGSSRSDFVRKLELIQKDFLEVVMTHRGDKLKLSQEELAQGAIYVGLEAVDNGLVDALGSQMDAIEKAAELAGLTRYEVVNVREQWQQEQSKSLSFQSEPDLTENAKWPVFYHLYTGEVR